MTKKIRKTDKEWREILTPEQYRVLCRAGTERPFTGKYNDHYEKGAYLCAACRTELFSSDAKYDHGTGWPSFSAPVAEDRIAFHDDYSHAMHRIEVRCAACGSHLGHVFDDGPRPTGKHYCINSVALDFLPATSAAGIKTPSASPAREGSAPSVPAKSRLAQDAQIATFAAGCFWGVEHKFRQVKGVLSTRVGYAGGHVPNPTYERVCSDTTGHAESVEIAFDPKVVSYDRLLELFFELHDPTQVNRQGPDVGSQYRSVVFYHNEQQKEAAQKMIVSLGGSGKFRGPIATAVVPAPPFYPAEDYHQQYYKKLRKSK
ncbi:MAG: bifunctional methionine sulfoxide reductase B/A protein [Acidobacteriota bacterium]